MNQGVWRAGSFHGKSHFSLPWKETGKRHIEGPFSHSREEAGVNSGAKEDLLLLAVLGAAILDPLLRIGAGDRSVLVSQTVYCITASLKKPFSIELH